MWIQVELPNTVTLSSIKLDADSSEKDFPNSFITEVSTDGRRWTKVTDEIKGTHNVTDISFSPTKAKFFRITTKSSKNLYWSIHEMDAFGK